MPIRRLIRRCLIVGYAGFCSLLGLLTLAAIHSGLPHKAEWSLEEAPAYYMAAPVSDVYWQWTPRPDWKLLALARTEASMGRRFIPGIGSPNRRVRVYFKVRAPEVSARIAATASEDPSQLIPCAGSTRIVIGPDGERIHSMTPGWDGKDEGPQPSWWSPTHRITIDWDHHRETFFVNPGEPEIVYFLTEDQLTVYSP